MVLHIVIVNVVLLVGYVCVVLLIVLWFPLRIVTICILVQHVCTIAIVVSV